MKRLGLLMGVGLLLILGQQWWPRLHSHLNPETVSITLDSNTTYQTILGWEATDQAGQQFCAGFDNYQAQLFDLAVNDLGLNRIRLEVRSGAESDQDYWTQFRQGQIDDATWRSVRYATVNDNPNPDVLNTAGFHFSELDHTIQTVIQPLRQRLLARGETLYVNLNYVAFTRQIGAGLSYDHDDPEEYAEFVLATYQHLQTTYGFVPDTWEIILEPDNVSQWSGTLIGEAMVATAVKLSAHGFTPAFVAPSNTDMGAAISYFDDLAAVPGATQYLRELSYHRYRGVSNSNLQALATRAAQLGIGGAMLEHIGSDYQDLHQDLKLGLNSSWQQFALGVCNVADNGGQYYLIDDTNPNNPVMTMGSRTKVLRQYFKFIRRGAVRIEATTSDNNFDPLAFVNTNGRYVVVVKAAAAGNLQINGLPAGTYGLKYTTQSQYDVNLPDVVLTTGQTLNADIPALGVITIYAKASPPPPTFTEHLYLPMVMSAGAAYQVECGCGAGQRP